MIGVIGYSDYLMRRTAPLLRSYNHSANESLLVGSDYLAASREPGIVGKSREEILHDPRITTVYISSATGNHYRDTLAALTHGKHVLVEKPICLFTEELAEIDGAAHRHNLVVAECLSYHFHPRWNRAMEILRGQRQKEELTLRAAFCIPHRTKSDFRYRPEHGGIVADLGTYVVDALLRAGLPMSQLQPPVGSIRISRLSGQVGTASQAHSHARWAIGDSYQNEFVVAGTTFRMDLQRAFSPPINEQTVLTMTSESESESPVGHVFAPANATHLCITNALRSIEDREVGIVDVDSIHERISILENVIAEGNEGA